MNLPYEQRNMRSGICFSLIDGPHLWLESWMFSLFTISLEEW